MNIFRACHMDSFSVGARLWRSHDDIKSFNINRFLNTDMHFLGIIYFEAMQFQVVTLNKGYRL